MIPCPEGLEYLPYQIEGIEFANPRPATLIADEPGLGKTVEAIGYMNCHQDEIATALVVCPDTAKINWARELDKWLVSPFVSSLIVNYEQLHRLDMSQRYDLAILDEAHYIQSSDAQRTQLCMQIQADRRLALDGTPMLSRPIGLWNILRWLAPDKFTDDRRAGYSTRYCDGHVAERQFSRWNGQRVSKKFWDESGASNLDELRENLRKHIMIRRLKTDVLKDLPPKRRQIIELPTGGLSAGLRRQIQEATREWDRIEREFAADVRAMEDRLIVAWEDMAELRHEVGLAKAKMSIDLIHDMVAGAGKLVVFAWHRDVIEMLENTLVDYRPSVLVGGMSPKAKQVAIDSFQNDPATKIFIGQLQASGTAITLTAASN